MGVPYVVQHNLTQPSTSLPNAVRHQVWLNKLNHQPEMVIRHMGGGEV